MSSLLCPIIHCLRRLRLQQGLDYNTSLLDYRQKEHKYLLEQRGLRGARFRS
jgi:hypothetical protein